MPPKKRKGNDPLTATKCSSTLHELVKDLESQAMAMERATYYAERDRAHACLSVTRASLYRYVVELEKRAGIEQTITLRF